jgi:hypothetical protein
MNGLDYPKWQQKYQAALVELDPKQLPARIHVAENAILVRLRELAGNPNGAAERHAITNARRALRILLVKRNFRPKRN